MKKNFFKKLSLVLAFAMVISAFAPAGAVFAAKKPALNAPATKYVHVARNAKGKNYTFNFNIKNKPAGKNKYKWTSSKPAIATVNAKNGIVNAKKAGATNIKVVITPAKGKKVTLSTKLVVRDNITEVDVKNPIDKTIVVGKEYDFDRTVVKTEAGKTKASATKGITRWLLVEKAADEKSEDKVTTFANAGKITFEETGKYSVTAVSFQSKAKYNEWVKADEFDLEDKLVTAKSDAYDFEVVNEIVGIKQKNTNTFTVEFTAKVDEKEIKEVKNIYRVLNGVDINTGAENIKSTELDETGKIATITVLADFDAKATYKFKFNNMEATFDAASTERTEIELIRFKEDKVNVTVGSITPVDLKKQIEAVNKDGVVIATGDTLAGLSFDAKDINNKGYVAQGSAYAFDEGSLGVLKAEYVEFVYDEEAKEYKEIKLEASAELVGTKEDTSVIPGSYQFALGTAKPAGDSKAWATTFNVPSNEGQQIFTRYKTKNSNDQYVDAVNYTYVSSDGNKAVITGDNVFFFDKGTVTITVKDATGKIVDAFVVTVVGDRVLKSVLPEGGPRVVVGNDTAIVHTETKTIIATDSMVDATTGIGKAISGAAITVKNNAGNLQVSGNLVTDKDGKATVTIGASGVTAGVYTLELEANYGNVTLPIRLNVVVADATNKTVAVWKVAPSQTEIDLKQSASGAAITVGVEGYNAAGAKVAELQTGEFTSEITDNNNSFNLTKVGKYVITVKSNNATATGRPVGAILATTTVEVINSKETSFKEKTSRVNQGSLEQVLNDAFEIKVEGNAIATYDSVEYIVGATKTTTNNAAGVTVAAGNIRIVSVTVDGNVVININKTLDVK